MKRTAKGSGTLSLFDLPVKAIDLQVPPDVHRSSHPAVTPGVLPPIDLREADENSDDGSGRGAEDGDPDRTMGHATHLEAQERSDSPSGFNSRPCPDASDVVRRVKHKAGPLRKVRLMTDAEREDSKLNHRQLAEEEFVLIELSDGTVAREFEDGSREPAPAMSHTLIEDALRYKEFVEVGADAEVEA